VSEQFSGRVTVVDGSQREVFAFDSTFAVLDLGAQGNEGDLRVRGDDGAPKIHLDGGRQLVTVTNAAGVTVLRFDASHSLLDLGPSLGGAGAEADLRIFGSDGQAKIHLDGQTGDIRLIGADCAEQFELEDPNGVQPGVVLTIGDGGRLGTCREAYDRRVAGVVSGAGHFRSGIVLDAREGAPHPLPIALAGKVFCQVDADYGPIDVGDLLTTSPTEGHAMRASDPSRAFGATLGKALDRWTSGTGLVPILVALQ
jgi:hypothetical protein